MGKLEKLMFSIGVRDEASGPVGKLQKVLNSTQKQAGAAFGKIGGGALAVATVAPQRSSSTLPMPFSPALPG